MIARTLFIAAVLCALGARAEDAPVALRVAHFTVPPSTGPVVHVLVKNLTDAPYEGVVRLTLPEGWAWSPGEQPVALEPGAAERVPFTISKAVNRADNRYEVSAEAVGAGTSVTRSQTIVCATAPYFAPEIDGDLDDWEHAPAVQFTCNGKQTEFRTYWNRRTFFVAAAVEEDDFHGLGEKDAAPLDALQFALAPHGARTPDSADGTSARYEFVVAGASKRRADPACCVLLEPGAPLSEALEPRPLADFALDGAEAAVKHKKGVTRYEVAVPFAAMPGIRATEGREISFSVRVHDPDGTGVRDWGAAAGLWPWQRSAWAWSRWQGDTPPEAPPYDGKIEWGLCSSMR